MCIALRAPLPQLAAPARTNANSATPISLPSRGACVRRVALEILRRGVRVWKTASAARGLRCRLTRRAVKNAARARTRALPTRRVRRAREASTWITRARLAGAIASLALRTRGPLKRARKFAPSVSATLGIKQVQMARANRAPPVTTNSRLATASVKSASRALSPRVQGPPNARNAPRTRMLTLALRACRASSTLARRVAAFNVRVTQATRVTGSRARPASQGSSRPQAGQQSALPAHSTPPPMLPPPSPALLACAMQVTRVTTMLAAQSAAQAHTSRI